MVSLAGQTLNRIVLSEFVVHFVFESEGTLDAYSRIEFYDGRGELLSSFSTDERNAIVVPKGLLIGKSVTKTTEVAGHFTVEFGTVGSVSICRIDDEIEIGLIAVAEGVKALR